MNLDDLKNEFDRALAAMSNEDIVKAFAAVDCVVEIVPPIIEEWIDCDVVCSQLLIRPSRETYQNEVTENPADSNELALAA